jgi:chemosensory pili system protein ChpA (sensor histidine kinase/response regulator)
VGDQFELPQWRHLLDVTHEAISLTNNHFGDLAAVTIKELKQAQELVLANRESEIAISAALQALLPLSTEPLAMALGSDDEFDREFDDLFDAAEFGLTESESDGVSEGVDDELFAEARPSTSEKHSSSGHRSAATSKPDQNKRHGPEVGSAELSSLADLFETSMDDLENWDSLDRAEHSHRNPLGDPDAEDMDSDFADLFASDEVTDPPFDDRETDADDDLDSLFDDIADGTEDDVSDELDAIKPATARSQYQSDREISASNNPASLSATDDFDDLLDLLETSAAEAETPNRAASSEPEASGLDLDELDFDFESDDANTAIENDEDNLATIDAIDFDFDLEGDLLNLDLPSDPIRDNFANEELVDLEDLFDRSSPDLADPVSTDRTAAAESEDVDDFDDFDDFDDLFDDIDSPERDRAPSEPFNATQNRFSSDVERNFDHDFNNDFNNDFDDDFDLFDLNVGEAETFAPPQTKPPIVDDEDLSLDDLFDDAGITAHEAETSRDARLSLESEFSDTDTELDDELEDDEFGDLFSGLVLSETEDNFDPLGDLDDLDLSEALADVSLDFDQILELMESDETDADIDTSLFPHLSIWLDLPTTDTGSDVFEVLEAYLEQSPSRLSPPLASDDSDFADLEHLLELDAPPSSGEPKLTADRALPTTSTSRGGARRQRGRGSAFEQTMRVPIKRLDDLSNLVGELVVNRNSLEDDQERLRQFLDNLLHQVSQLSEVGQRMQDLYERTLLEMALLASRKNRTMAAQGGMSNANDEGDEDFDALEMDKFSLFHLQAQEIIELVVRVRESSSDIEFLVDENDQVTRQLRQVTTQLQEGLNRSRMVAFSNATDRLLRGVRDNAIKFGKQVNLQIEGRDMLIDRMILEHLYDPLTHLVNNAIAHGVETPEERIAKGKPAQGTITVSSFNQGNQTIIAISDDGAGIDKDRVASKAVQKGLVSQEQAHNLTDPEIYDLLFLPNFSTRDMADDLAGRGVGMDVVKTKLNEIRGVIITDSTRDQGTTFTIRLPLTLSISKALCCISDHAPIAFPMDGVSEVLDNLPSDRIIREDDDTAYVQWREQKVPYQPLSSLFNYSRLSIRPQMYGSASDDDTVSVVILRSAGSQLAISVDSIVGEQEIVIKQLEGPIPKPVGITGATVMGDGHIVPIADVLELIDLSLGRVRRDASSLWDETEEATVVQVEKAEPMVLIIDDSITVRELLSMTFKKSGYRVEQARDGQEAWEKMRSGLPCELVFCDMEMPRMNGMELLEKMSNDPRLSELPIAMLTSRTAEKMKRRAGELGAKGYFTKPYLEEVLLDAAQRMLAGENLMASNTSAEPAPAS